MESLYKQIVERQATQIGQLTTNVMELDIRLVQALQTINALEKEKEGVTDGNATESNTGDSE